VDIIQPEASRPPVSTASARELLVRGSSRAPSVPRSTRAPSVTRSARASSVPRSRAGSVPRSPRTKKVLSLPPLKKPTFNPLPTPCAPKRPAMQLFVFGNGDMGQFGMGTGEQFLCSILNPEGN
jgi:regulator of chromosome condensation